MRGRFIVFEGLDGSGKSTQLARLAQSLRERGGRVELTEEPTATALGGMIRDALSRRCERTADELAALFLADRVAHNVGKDGIRALTERGVDVVCHRYYYSSLVYQGMTTDAEWVRDMNLRAPAIMRPDLCVFIDTPPEACLERLCGTRATLDIFEEKLETLRAARERFTEVFRDGSAAAQHNGSAAARENVFTVDGTLDVDEIAARILSAVDAVRV